MNLRRTATVLGVIVLGVLIGPGTMATAEQATMRLATSQSEFLRLEPILVTLKVEGDTEATIPAAPGGESITNLLRFEIEPAVKPRPHAQSLPREGQTALSRTRKFDLLEWYQFPDHGTFSVRAVFEHAGTRLVSEPIHLTIRKPEKGDPEFEAVARLHHIPWSNYDTNAYCGDTFDVVKRWPDSKLARYCHYWNGRYSQNQKEYDKAIASYEALLTTYPDFILAEDARHGIEECKNARNKP